MQCDCLTIVVRSGCDEAGEVQGGYTGKLMRSCTSKNATRALLAGQGVQHWSLPQPLEAVGGVEQQHRQLSPLRGGSWKLQQTEPCSARETEGTAPQINEALWRLIFQELTE